MSKETLTEPDGKGNNNVNKEPEASTVQNNGEVGKTLGKDEINISNRSGLDGKSKLEKFWLFFSSGLFFMLFGSSLLFLAHITMNNAHSSFTFVLVVVGVAILLYGTGTQGAGEFIGETEKKYKYKAVIAGGAGLLAIGIGAGMVLEHDEIQSAFQVQKKYGRVRLHPANDKDDFFGYTTEAKVDGIDVPTMLRGNNIEIYVPYLVGEKDKKKTISINIYSHLEPKDPLKKKSVVCDREIDMSKIKTDVGAHEFPQIEIDNPVISLREDFNPVNSSIVDKGEIGDEAGKNLPKPTNNNGQ